MRNSKLILLSLLHSLGVVAYVILVVIIMNNGGQLFGGMNDIWGPIAFLLLFVISAAITGLLVFGRPVYLFLNGYKTEAVKFTLYTVGFLFLETVIFFVGLALFK